MATVFEAGIGTSYAVGKGVFSGTPVPRNIQFDIYFDCLGYDRDGNQNKGVGFSYASGSGEKPFVDFVATGTSYASASGTLILGNVFTGTATSYAIASGELTLEGLKENWVAWSDVGSLSFTKDRNNVAGSTPLDWKGSVYNVRKLGSKIISYGANGVSILSPSGKLMGMNTIHRIGLLGRDAFAGTDFVHYFIDKLGYLYQLTGEGLVRLDYKEYLEGLTNPVLTLDKSTNLLYICDGTTGFIYSPDSQSLGKGPPNVTGIGFQSGVLYVASPAAIVVPDFEVWTATNDFGTRKGKNIFSIDIGTDLTETIQAAIRTRQNKASAFVQTGWYVVDDRGQSWIPCYGVEFQFGFRVPEYDYFEVDYIDINGEVLVY
jgi:hypothetical protein